MESLILLFKIIIMLLAGAAVGNWFLTKAKEGRARSEPAYKAYLTPPGLIILLAVAALPFILWWME